MMRLEKLDLHPEAVAEARAAREWYEERSAVAASRFVVELEHALERINDSPESWPPYLHGTRRYLLRHYPYQVVYRVAGDRVQVIAIAHARRRPGYWRYR